MRGDFHLAFSMAGVATVFAGRALAGETPCALTTEIAVRRDREGSGLEFVCLGATFDVANGFKDGLNLNLEGS